jgi:hypothetical protein
MLPDSPLVSGDVLFMLPLKLANKVTDHPVIEILSAQVSITSSRLNLKDTILNG